jgi:hypothetical protein
MGGFSQTRVTGTDQVTFELPPKHGVKVTMSATKSTQDVPYTAKFRDDQF